MDENKEHQFQGTRLPLSQGSTRTVFVRAVELGRVDVGQHFTDRCGERGVSTIDAENLLRYGVFGSPRYDEDYDNWVYEVIGRIDGKSWKLVVALDCSEDMWDMPRITLVTTHRVGGKRKAGRKDKDNDKGEGSTDNRKEVPSVRE